MTEQTDHLQNEPQRYAVGYDAAKALADAAFSFGMMFHIGRSFKPENQLLIADLIHASGAIGTIMDVGSSLVKGSLDLLQAKNVYSAAALARQLVEIEYLSWCFSNKLDTAKKWILSDYATRKNMFQPRHLRAMADGRFLDDDYKKHCELGGHPSPDSLHLVRANHRDRNIYQVDILYHTQSICRQTSEFLSRDLSEESPHSNNLALAHRKILELFDTDQFVLNLVKQKRGVK